MNAIQEDAVKALFRVRVQSEEGPRQQAGVDLLSRATAFHGGTEDGSAPATVRPRGRRRRQPAPVQQRRVTQRVGRNDPCPCGSGKKYKHCCGKAS